MVDAFSNSESTPARAIHQPSKYWDAEYSVVDGIVSNDPIIESSNQHYIKVCPRLGTTKKYTITVKGIGAKEWTDTVDVEAGRESSRRKNKKMMQEDGKKGRRGKHAKHGKHGRRGKYGKYGNQGKHGKYGKYGKYGRHWRENPRMKGKGGFTGKGAYNQNLNKYRQDKKKLLQQQY